LLVSALIVIPNITALLFGKGFKKTALISVSISVFSVMAGIAISYAFDVAPGATVVLIATAIFLGTLAAKSTRKRASEKLVKEIRS